MAWLGSTLTFKHINIISYNKGLLFPAQYILPYLGDVLFTDLYFVWIQYIYAEIFGKVIEENNEMIIILCVKGLLSTAQCYF